MTENRLELEQQTTTSQ